jgi:hypothetical protein
MFALLKFIFNKIQEPNNIVTYTPGAKHNPGIKEIQVYDCHYWVTALQTSMLSSQSTKQQLNSNQGTVFSVRSMSRSYISEGLLDRVSCVEEVFLSWFDGEENNLGVWWPLAWELSEENWGVDCELLNHWYSVVLSPCCEKLAAEAGDSLVTQRKGNVSTESQYQATTNDNVTVDTTVCVYMFMCVCVIVYKESSTSGYQSKPHLKSLFFPHAPSGLYEYGNY